MTLLIRHIDVLRVRSPQSRDAILALNVRVQAIEFLHSIKLIHTDLKPENVLLTSWEDRDVKLESGDVIRVPANPHIKGEEI